MWGINKSVKEISKWSKFILGLRPKHSFDKYTPPTRPEYDKLDTWVSHPEKNSKASLRPEGLDEEILNEVPTFFIHPTSFFGADNWNAAIDHKRSRSMIEELVLPGQASVLNHLGEIYAPIYRQATFYSFMMSSSDAFQALDLAYADVEAAFDSFIDQIEGKPFFILGHSQGSLLGMRLLTDRIEKDETLRKRLVAAYLPGYKLPLANFEDGLDFIKKGEQPDQVHCVLAWDTFLDGFHPLHHIDNAGTWIVKSGVGKWKKRLSYTPFTINPLTWDVNISEATKSSHQGAVVNVYDRSAFKWIDANAPETKGVSTIKLSAPTVPMIDVKVGRGNLLYISKPVGRIYNIGKLPGENYHVYDINLFYMNIRSNATLRWEKYKSLYLA